MMRFYEWYAPFEWDADKKRDTITLSNAKKMAAVSGRRDSWSVVLAKNRVSSDEVSAVGWEVSAKWTKRGVTWSISCSGTSLR